ncbi:hypothetical protein [Loigolactobacillus zhaoyuanensis]|uniref:DUF2589 domain-containing protein n=1 Tax=Loigolactobacillus zhaoyuanensis TaxID=2486017 RepID=A0ABW8UFM1_9LACO|nr:hypothetical protein [Loigolactobacillus zhaoyuanensis]
MEMQSQEFIAAIRAEEYTTTDIKLTATDIKKTDLKKLTTAYSQLQTQLAAQKIGQIKIDLPFEVPATIELQAGIINLPYELVNKIALLTNAEEQRPLNLYLITTAENLNASGMRIDQMSSVVEFLQSPQLISDKINAAITEKLTELQAAADAPAEE